MARTQTRKRGTGVEDIHGVEIKEGDKVLAWHKLIPNDKTLFEIKDRKGSPILYRKPGEWYPLGHKNTLYCLEIQL